LKQQYLLIVIRAHDRVFFFISGEFQEVPVLVIYFVLTGRRRRTGEQAPHTPDVCVSIAQGQFENYIL